MKVVILLLCFTLVPLLNAVNFWNCYLDCLCTPKSVMCNRGRLSFIPDIQNHKIFYLDMPGNEIREIQTNCLKNFENLVRIDFSNNQISKISEHGFHGPLYLKKLLLNNNKIRHLPEEIFSDHIESLEVLDLSNNRLTKLPISLEKLVNIKYVNLMGNPLYCGCEVRVFANSIRKNRNMEIKFPCDNTFNWKDQDILEKNIIDKCQNTEENVESLPILTSKPKDVRVAVGEEARFECRVSNINNTRIEWILPLSESDTVNFYWRNQILIIREVQPHHFGIVKCQASNKLGSRTVSASLSFAEFEKPFFNIKPENVTVKKGSKVIFLCNASGFPRPKITWLKVHGRTSELESGGKYTIRPNKLIIEDVTETEAKFEYICYATSLAGSGKVSVSVTLESSDDLINLKVCEEERKIFNETLNNARNLINSVLNESSTKQSIQTLLRRPNNAAMILSKLNDAREKVLELYNEMEEKCKILPNTSDKSTNQGIALSSEQLAIFSHAFGCQGSHNEKSCSQHKCFHKQYRSFDGKCNNLKHPGRGSSVYPFYRLLKPEYENGIFTPIGWNIEKSYFGFPKPSARLVSTKLLRANKVIPNPDLSVMVMQWGQFLDHDLDFTPVDPTFSRSSGGIACNDTCVNDPPCFPIPVPPGDERIKSPCIGFSRSIATCGSGDKSLAAGFQYREQVNQITSYIDASNVYGSNLEDAENLRNLTFDEGKLRVGMNSVVNKHLLPFNVNGIIDCQKDFRMRHVECFKAGDHRSNENLGLLSVHTIWVREHNRLSEELRKINKHWSGDKIYFETRKIVGALMQKITYKDWLPIILGENINKLGIYQGYNDSVDSTISNVFAAAAMRFGHTLINPILYRLNESFEEISEKHLPLHKAFFAPMKMMEDGGIDPILRGLFAKGSKMVMSENPMNTELIEKLFKMAHDIALDLGSLNIQRGRDHGLPSYNSWRKYCGLKPAETFDDFSGEIPSAEIREKMRQVYGHPGNVDLFAGSVLEKKVPTALVGPTFSCILSDQFKRLRDGDRFFYESFGQFTKKQLEELNQGSLARVVCDNGDNINHVQKDIFKLPRSKDGFINCENIPKINLSYWKDCKSRFSNISTDEDSCENSFEEPNGFDQCT